jgi:hypothetical protein
MKNGTNPLIASEVALESVDRSFVSEFLKLRSAEVGMKAFAVDRYSTERLEVNILGDGIVLISLVSFEIAEVDILDGRQGKVF